MLRRTLSLGAAALAVLLASCSENPAPVSSGTRAAAPTYAFDEVRHVVLANVDAEAYEIVTAVAHVCGLTEADCPDGNEPLVLLGSYYFDPSDVHLAAPEVMLEPPAECLADQSYCVLSLAYCEFTSAEDQRSAQHCVPEHSSTDTAAAQLTSGDHHECVDPQTTHSRHVDLDCLNTGAATS